jgi:hypothetical protein
MRRILLAFSILLPPLSGQNPAAALEHARRVNLERAAKLPNFVADETAKRYKSRHTNPPNWEYVDTIESQIAVKGSDFKRERTTLNGKPWTKPNFPDFSWSVQFGDELEPLFSPKCGTRIDFDGREEVRGKQRVAYRFHAPPNGCFGAFTVRAGLFSGTKRYNPAWSGRFLIEDPGGSVVQFEEEAHQFPKGFGADPLTQTTTWDYVKIGEASYLLPIATEIFGGFTRGDLWHVVVEYKNHRHFEAATDITFQPVP